jgi:hypothetical protein
MWQVPFSPKFKMYISTGQYGCFRNVHFPIYVDVENVIALQNLLYCPLIEVQPVPNTQFWKHFRMHFLPRMW